MRRQGAPLKRFAMPAKDVESLKTLLDRVREAATLRGGAELASGRSAVVVYLDIPAKTLSSVRVVVHDPRAEAA